VKAEQTPLSEKSSEQRPSAAVSSQRRTFIDLKAFAADESQGTAPPASADDDRFQSSRRLLALPSGPATVGVIALAAGSGEVSRQPADEFVIVSDGTITCTQGERTFTLHAGSSAVIPRGATFSWSTPARASIVFMRCEGSPGADGEIVPIDDAPTLAPSGAPLAELLLTPTPQCRNQTDYLSANGEFTCGTWDSTPYHRKAMFYRHCELMYLLQGSVTFEDESGKTATFSRGDIFLVEQGARCSWDSREHVAKVYAIYRPA
jgi:uncharacterized cupin superfamily protein